MKPKIVIAGGSGFLGQVLSSYFTQAGNEVIVLTRTPRRNGEVQWDGKTVGKWTATLEGASAIINLAGRTVDCRYTSRNRKAMLESRVYSTRVLGEAISPCKVPPALWLNASTATIYKHNYGAPWDENGVIGDTPAAKDKFSIEVACAWEHEFNRAVTPRTRKVGLRTAMVLGLGENSVFPVLRGLVRFGLGGQMGDGQQFVSWIHQDDFCRAVKWIMNHPELSGVINVCAPTPLTNSEMMENLRDLCGRKFGLPATRLMLEIGAFLLRTETELIIKSRRVIPRRLLDSGFHFAYNDFRSAAIDLIGSAAVAHSNPIGNPSAANSR